MQGDRAIIQRLNEVLTNELTSVNQYFLHARMLQNWGFRRLGGIVYDESIGEVKHADTLIKRILFLDGLPNLQDLHKLSVGETVLEALNADLALELAGRAALVAGVAQCEAAQDFVSREMLAEILSDTEEAHRFPGNPHRPRREARRAKLPAERGRRIGGRRRRGLGGIRFRRQLGTQGRARAGRRTTQPRRPGSPEQYGCPCSWRRECTASAALA
jgi:bacterioferritin